MAETTTPGIASGRVMVPKTCHRFAPSTRAAWSMSRGMERNWSMQSQITSGMLNVK
jgi:hypothetical protein